MVDNLVNKVHVSIWKFISILRFWSNFGHTHVNKSTAKRCYKSQRCVPECLIFSSLSLFCLFLLLKDPNNSVKGEDFKACKCY